MTHTLFGRTLRIVFFFASLCIFKTSIAADQTITLEGTGSITACPYTVYVGGGFTACGRPDGTPPYAPYSDSLNTSGSVKIVLKYTKRAPFSPKIFATPDKAPIELISASVNNADFTSLLTSPNPVLTGQLVGTPQYYFHYQCNDGVYCYKDFEWLEYFNQGYLSTWTTTDQLSNQYNSQSLTAGIDLSTSTISVNSDGSLTTGLPKTTGDGHLSAGFNLYITKFLQLLYRVPSQPSGSNATVEASYTNSIQLTATITKSSSNSAVSTIMLDPVPLSVLGTDSLLSGSRITTNTEVLATVGRQVNGVAADGVAQVVIRIPAIAKDQSFTLALDPSTTATCTSKTGPDCGVLFDPLSTSVDPLALGTSSTVTVKAVDTSKGPMAFVAYRAPIDFVRGDTQVPAEVTADQQAAQRFVTVITPSTSPGQIAPLQIRIVRPPVALIHGIWADKLSWQYLNYSGGQLGHPNRIITPSTPLWTQTIDYSAKQPLGVLASVATTSTQIIDSIIDFRGTVNVAAIQTDVVAHSLGGLLTRALAASTSSDAIYQRPSNFNAGDIHKLITLDTPYAGSEFAARFKDSSSRCKLLFDKGGGRPYHQSVEDLLPKSDLIVRLNIQSSNPHIHTNAVVGTASASQIKATEDNWFNAVNGEKSLLKLFCSDLLPTDGFAGVFGQDSDLVVSQSSQSASGIGVDGTIIPTTPAIGVVHSADPIVFVQGPSILGNTIDNDILSATFYSSVPDLVQRAKTTAIIMNLLNASVGGPLFKAIKP